MNYCKKLYLLSFFFLIISGCGGGGGGSTGDQTNLQPTLSSIQDKIFTPKCALSDCHGNDIFGAQANMNLSNGKTHENVVDKNSNDQFVNMVRVKPGDPDHSYLVKKIEGSAQSVGGIPDQMPKGSNPLSAAEISAIREWITLGANND